MREQIENILHNEMRPSYWGSISGHQDAGKALEILFLEKQIDELRNLYLEIGVKYGAQILKRLNKLQSQLTELKTK